MLRHRAWLAYGFALVGGLASAAWAGPPTDQLNTQIDRVLAVLRDPALQGAEHRARRQRVISDAMDAALDFTETSRRALGAAWNVLSSSERQEFVSAFTGFLKRPYVGQIDKYESAEWARGVKLVYDDERVEDALATVTARIEWQDGDQMPLTFKMIRGVDGRWRVYDVIMEGVSVIDNYRAQFRAILRRGSYEDLLKRIKSQGFVAGVAPEPSSPEPEGPSYDAPKLRIAVADFENKTSPSGQYRGEYGRGLSDMLVIALSQTKRYVTVEREKLQAAMSASKLHVSDLFTPEPVVQLGNLEADLLVAGAITGFDPTPSARDDAQDGLLPMIRKLLERLGFGGRRGRITADLRIIDVRTGKIVAATNVAGTVGDGATEGGDPLGGDLGTFAKTPMEGAIRELVQKSVEFVMAKTPPAFARHRPSGPARAVVSAATTARPPTPRKTEPARAEPEKVLHSIQSDFDEGIVARLTEVRVRGVVLSAVISLGFQGTKPESEPIDITAEKSHVLDYNTGQMYQTITISGFSSGRLKPGEVKIVRVTFKAPQDAKTVRITLAGLGSFEDVALEP